MRRLLLGLAMGGLAGLLSACGDSNATAPPTNRVPSSESRREDWADWEQDRPRSRGGASRRDRLEDAEDDAQDRPGYSHRDSALFRPAPAADREPAPSSRPRRPRDDEE